MGGDAQQLLTGSSTTAPTTCSTRSARVAAAGAANDAGGDHPAVGRRGGRHPRGTRRSRGRSRRSGGPRDMPCRTSRGVSFPARRGQAYRRRVARWLIAATAAILVAGLAWHVDATPPTVALFGPVTALGVVLMAPDLSTPVRTDIGRALALGVLLGLMGTWLQHDASERADEQAQRDKRRAGV